MGSQMNNSALWGSRSGEAGPLPAGALGLSVATQQAQLLRTRPGALQTRSPSPAPEVLGGAVQVGTERGGTRLAQGGSDAWG